MVIRKNRERRSGDWEIRSNAVNQDGVNPRIVLGCPVI